MNERFRKTLTWCLLMSVLAGMLGAASLLPAAPATAASPVAAVQRNANGTYYFFYTPKPGGELNEYLRWTMTNLNHPGTPYDLRGIEEITIHAFTPIDQTTGSFSGTWGTANGPAYYGGNLRFANVSGAFAEINISVEENQRLSLIVARNVDGGYAYVTIDGQASLANLLPTDAAGNRVIDSYSPAATLYGNQRAGLAIAEGLAPGTHTVRVIVSGLRNSASRGTRIYLDGLAISAQNESVEGEFFVNSAVKVGDTNDAYEYAYRVATNNRIYGTQNHGGETLLGMTFRLDGTVVNLANYQTARATTINLMQDTRLGDSTFPNLATIHRSYNFYAEGLDLDLSTTWNTSVPLNAAYQAMFSVVEGATVSSAGFVDGYTTPFSLTDNNNSIKGRTFSMKAWAWNNTNNRVATLEITGQDPFLNTANMFIQDSSQDNKLYFLRQNTNYTPGAGETWHVVNRYRVFNGIHP